MQKFARGFYLSPAWRHVRRAILLRDAGLCVRCGRPGEIVHHIIPLTPENIGDPNITLSADNLQTLCRDCHATVHAQSESVAEGLSFDREGNLVRNTPRVGRI